MIHQEPCFQVTSFLDDLKSIVANGLCPAAKPARMQRWELLWVPSMEVGWGGLYRCQDTSCVFVHVFWVVGVFKAIWGNTDKTRKWRDVSKKKKFQKQAMV